MKLCSHIYDSQNWNRGSRSKNIIKTCTYVKISTWIDFNRAMSYLIIINHYPVSQMLTESRFLTAPCRNSQAAPYNWISGDHLLVLSIICNFGRDYGNFNVTLAPRIYYIHCILGDWFPTFSWIIDGKLTIYCYFP